MTSEGARLIDLLDEFQAAERAGAEALDAWCGVCEHPRLRGGLRVMRARDAHHAALTEARLLALGGRPTAQVGPGLQALFGVLASPEVTDRSKLAILMARFPAQDDDPVAVLLAGTDEDDGETRALLETIAADDRASRTWLHGIGGIVGPEGAWVSGAERELVVRFVDALRAAETASAEVVEAWSGCCDLPALRGGLATIAAREAAHAQLLADRLRELGAVPRVTLGADVLGDALACYGAPAVSDTDKLDRVLARYGDDDAPALPLATVMELLRDDVETREMLGLIADAERATVGWLRAYRAGLASGGTSVAAGA